MTTHSRSAVVTGAAGGLGAATVRRLAASGWQVFAADLDSSALALLAGPSVTPLVVDVTDPASVAKLRAAVEESVDRLDALVTFAGVVGVGPLLREALRRA